MKIIRALIIGGKREDMALLDVDTKRVFVNNVLCTCTDQDVKAGDEITIRPIVERIEVQVPRLRAL